MHACMMMARRGSLTEQALRQQDFAEAKLNESKNNAHYFGYFIVNFFLEIYFAVEVSE